MTKIEKIKEKEKLERATTVNAIIEMLDGLEELGADFQNAKRAILRWANKHKLYD